MQLAVVLFEKCALTININFVPGTAPAAFLVLCPSVIARPAWKSFSLCFPEDQRSQVTCSGLHSCSGIVLTHRELHLTTHSLLTYFWSACYVLATVLGAGDVMGSQRGPVLVLRAS